MRPLAMLEAGIAPPVDGVMVAEVVGAAAVLLLFVEYVGLGMLLIDPEGFMPAQKPPTQVLYAHCESREQVAWKFPQTGMRPELTA
jgi:UPF0716 family protein affecting phage T7 exclusion